MANEYEQVYVANGQLEADMIRLMLEAQCRRSLWADDRRFGRGKNFCPCCPTRSSHPPSEGNGKR
jgi:hypothetical protein